MTTLKYPCIFLMSFLFLIPLNAQDTNSGVVTSEFTVKGVCKMCKSRIEKAALIKGVKFAEWNKEEQQIKVMYKAGKAELEQIKKSIAEAGHDTDSIKASDDAYAKLPDCCAYRDGVGIH